MLTALNTKIILGLDLQYTVVAIIIFTTIFLRLVVFWLNFEQLKTIFAKPQIFSYSVVGISSSLLAFGSSQRGISSLPSHNKNHSTITNFSDLQRESTLKAKVLLCGLLLVL